MASIINAATSGGLITTADTSGILQLQTAGTTAVTVDASQRAAFVAGTAALPAITTTGDTNTGIFFPAADTIAFAEGGAEAMRIDSSGNLGIGTTTPDVFSRAYSGKIVGISSASGESALMINSSGTNVVAFEMGRAGSRSTLLYDTTTSTDFGTITSKPLTFVTVGTERARIDSSGNLLVGTTSTIGGVTGGSIQVQNNGSSSFIAKQLNATADTLSVWSSTTAGNNIFAQFYTETAITSRGSISYNRAGGLVAYNTTSDYRAKDISGPLTGSGALIDSVPVYMGTMKGATQERPMFIAHEVPAYAHTGEKDAVDADGNPVYQQMDASALIPVMWAEIQSLRQRITALEGAQA